MAKEFLEVEDILADESFLSWYQRKPGALSRAWEQWMEAHPEKLNLVDKAVQFLQSMPADRPTLKHETEAAWDRLNSSLDTGVQEEKSAKSTGSVRKIYKWIAAAAAIGLITFWAIRQQNIRNPEETWQTAYGQVQNILLPDGSEIQLNANSILRGKNLRRGSQDRELWLEGEAFFQVKSMRNGQGMRVHTSAGDIVVTGTAFNVENRHDKVKVLLTEGSVSLESNNREWKLQPGQLAEWTGNDYTIVRADTLRDLAWRRGMIVMDHSSLQELADLIRDYYGKTVKVQGELDPETRISGLMPNNRLDELMEGIRLITGWTVELREDTIQIIVN